MKKTITCIICPKGCQINVEGDRSRVALIENAQCTRGETYAATEFTHPCRILTSSVRMEGDGRRMLPIRSSAPIPREMLLACMHEIQKCSISTPVQMHQVIIPDILGSGVDMIACMPVVKDRKPS